jgi:hypothetical protein
MAINYTNIVHCETLKNLPKFGSLVWKSGNPGEFAAGDDQLFEDKWLCCAIGKDLGEIISLENALSRWHWTLGKTFLCTVGADLHSIKQRNKNI